jgi:hypothetical protein
MLALNLSKVRRPPVGAKSGLCSCGTFFAAATLAWPSPGEIEARLPPWLPNGPAPRHYWMRETRKPADQARLPQSILLPLGLHLQAQKAKDKWNKHGRNYDVIGYTFAPRVMTTYGQIHGHLLRLCGLCEKSPARA